MDKHGLQPNAQERGCGQSVSFDLKDQRTDPGLHFFSSTQAVRGAKKYTKCDRFFSHKSKMKGTNRTKAAPERRPA